MNRAILSLFALSFSLLEQSLMAAGPEEVAGIRWEATPIQVRQILTERPGVTLETETPDTLSLKGGTFGGFNVKSWRFTFTDGKVGSVLLSFDSKPGKDAKGWFADQDFAQLQKLLEQKYGKARVTFDQNHQARSWVFPDALSPGASKTIELYRGFGGDRSGLDLTYTYTRGSGAKKPIGTSTNPIKDF
jgi:hypothetical protein